MDIMPTILALKIEIAKEWLIPAVFQKVIRGGRECRDDERVEGG
eukprot:CAMPEP_0179352876 /NCGR_PEP_ID=MMETSP0797-20121207/76030_1 /TAXON_ID=47934 /ORGANISM="Dinophysis acuminata, Strain DAEP01" /LENGTH=43 /DNA_ID= /DNA_START= /DNA_END= /DNA_ORIENTATION=